MRVLINVSNLRFGGGKTVGLNILTYYLNNSKIRQLLIIAPSSCGYEYLKDSYPKARFVFLSRIFNCSFLKVLTNYVILPFLSVTSKCDFVLSLGNIAFPVFNRPQFLLIHQSFLAYPDSLVWDRVRLDDKSFYIYLRRMIKFIKINLRYASVIGVQTETMRSRISGLYDIPKDRILVIPNAVSFNCMKSDIVKEDTPSNQIRLLFLSKYYPHKNFEILFELAKRVKEFSLPIHITITIEKTENSGSMRFLEMVDKLDLNFFITNIGNVAIDDIERVYKEHDGLFLPTLLESFSGTYIESMFFGKPIFTSKMDFAVDVCKDAAFYFDPFDPLDILNVVSEAFANPELIDLKVGLGRGYAMDAKSWNDIGHFIDERILKL
ncbi:glycosyltransferase involved in cell wall biosynthesis [Arcticibacter tournemirensis]|uniref:Glycosyltransferase family 4 protein n=1 Tax=Arcticibacter tournemirensis TaxID=699437 RepID=A0A5M9HGM8_9SPHI|nr:glycosyltransferase [Arcticibacter tournemirensis]KAA8484661.1 glycosyltransferase family 4 protein [Arcticibacter tournemirensis]TQM47047.1 glycosyltransferase involved in cell wall biosynthesis [Arcticibacter tournemirensis]